VARARSPDLVAARPRRENIAADGESRRLRSRPAASAFIIAHQGATGDDVVLAWWDHENELPVRVLVRRQGEPWRAAEDTESVCVWDLEIFWHERQAWVETVLSSGSANERTAYLSRAFLQPS
jgi:hypothetical protein